MSKTTLFCAHIARIKSALAADSPVNVEQTIKGLLAQYGLGEVVTIAPTNKPKDGIILRCFGTFGAHSVPHYIDPSFELDSWSYVYNERKLYGDARFQDVLCPDCQKHEREKQLTK